MGKLTKTSLNINNRIFYLDFIRMIATFIIVLTHYNALFVFNYPSNPSGILWSANIFNVYLGDFGVSLFLILSGASLMITYGGSQKINLKKYYFKRFITTLPLFWISWLIVFAISFGTNPARFDSVPLYRIIYTLLGIDGYLTMLGVNTYFLVGEWFLGFILIFYIVAPALIFCINKKPKITAFFIVTLFGLSFLLKDVNKIQYILSGRLIEIGFGMYFIKYCKTGPKNPLVAACLFILQICNFLIKPDFIPQIIQVTYIGISAFYIIGFIGSFSENIVINKIVKFMVKISYPCFLIHHTIIYSFCMNVFDLKSVNTQQSFGIFLIAYLLIILASLGLSFLYSFIKKISSNFVIKININK